MLRNIWQASVQKEVELLKLYIKKRKSISSIHTSAFLMYHSFPGVALEHLTNLMKEKGDAPLARIQGYEQSYVDGARRLVLLTNLSPVCTISYVLT